MVRRRKSAKSESGDNNCKLDVNGDKLVEHRCFGIPEVYIHRRNPRVKQWFAVKPNSISSRTRTKFKYK